MGREGDRPLAHRLAEPTWLTGHAGGMIFGRNIQKEDDMTFVGECEECGTPLDEYYHSCPGCATACLWTVEEAKREGGELGPYYKGSPGLKRRPGMKELPGPAPEHGKLVSLAVCKGEVYVAAEFAVFRVVGDSLKQLELHFKEEDTTE